MTAVWTQPRTWTAGELITASMMNTHVRDNLDWLKTPVAAKDTASSISTASATLVDVTGSSVTLTTNGGGVDFMWVGTFSCTTIAVVNFALIQDTTTIVSFNLHAAVAAYIFNCSFPYHIDAPSAGSHTYKMQVSTTAGTVTVNGFLTYAVERGA